MNKYQKAYEDVFGLNVYSDGPSEEFVAVDGIVKNESIKTLKELVDRAKPMKPDLVYKGAKCECPKCHKELWYGGHHFCKDCGQALSDE